MFRFWWECRRWQTRPTQTWIWRYWGWDEISFTPRRPWLRHNWGCWTDCPRVSYTDVGLWQIPATHDMREFWAERGTVPEQKVWISRIAAIRREQAGALFSKHSVFLCSQTDADQVWSIVVVLLRVCKQNLLFSLHAFRFWCVGQSVLLRWL